MKLRLEFAHVVLAIAASVQRVSATQLPVPCAGSACGASATSFVSTGTATATQVGSTLSINQSSNTATLNWASFNVSADGRIVFNQPSSTAVALNRIFQASPSTIFGQLTANGQIYLVNANGFVFGSTASVNTAGLIVSSLQISDAVFSAGLLAPQWLNAETPVLASADDRTTVLDNSGNPVLGTNGQPIPVSITIDQGATLSTPSGRMLLAAPQVQNSGTLSAPDGQIVLAAGQQVFLQASQDPDLRGLVVEVNGGGTAANLLTGQISAPRGNITLVGLAVNQDGRISATTSVTANGSVRLEAADTTTFLGGGGATPVTIASSVGGSLELGPQSSIDIAPELSSSATAVADQAQLPSQVTLLGQQILIHGASITAPSGQLQVTAAADPAAGVSTDGNSAARIRIDSGTTIDLSGSSAELPMSANLVAIRLGANELADDPDQVNGALHGDTVYVDARVGSPLINSAAFDAAVSSVPETIAQRTENGGTATFASEGDVVMQPGASINVSGGQTTYQSGILQTTQLVGANGQLYGIGSANPLLTYTGVINPTFTQSFNSWGVQQVIPTPGLSQYQQGYVQGAAAGSVSIAAPNLVLSGMLVGQAVNGPQQRGSDAVSGGQLVIGLPGGLASNTTDFLAPSVEFVTQPSPVTVSDSAPLLSGLLQLPVQYLTEGGFTSTRIFSNGTVTVPSGVPLDLNAGGSLFLQGARVDVAADITAPGGSIQLRNADTIDVTDGVRPEIQIGDDITLNVNGLWTNDYLLLASGTNPVGLTLQNGGSISLAPGVPGSELVIGNNVSLDANGGAWLNSSGVVSPGSGGYISILAAPPDSALQVGSGIELNAFGVAGAKGGAFALSAPRIVITNSTPWTTSQRVDDLAVGGGDAPAGEFNIGASLFTDYGFSQFSLVANSGWTASTANNDSLTVQAGTAIAPVTQSLQLLPGYQFQPTGAALASFTQVTLLPLYLRAPTQVSLAEGPDLQDTRLTSAGLLDVQPGASIISDPLSSIALSSPGGVYIDGTLRAPGGTISLSVPGPSGGVDLGYLPNLAIQLGPQAVLDASGVFIPHPNNQNLLLGTVLNAGSISLVANRGSVITDAGSEIDLNGTSATVDEPTALSGGMYALFDVPSAAGSLLVQAPESISLLGNLDAHAGSGNFGDPSGGSLEVDLTRSEFFAPPANSGLQATFPTPPRVIELVSQLPSNATPENPDSGLAVLGITELAASGVDSLRLEAGDEILLSSNLPLSLARQFIADAPAIAVAPGISASVSANFVELGYSIPAASTATPAPGNGTLSVNAQQIDLLGSFALQNIANTRLNSAGDIQLLDVYDGTLAFGNLALDGNLTLSAERVYPSTDASFNIGTVHTASDPASMVDTVTLLQSGPSPGTPLSAGGAVSISADSITSGGTLLAPFGSITLSTSDSLNLNAGSLTSVSGAGLTVPYGSTQLGGEQWIYTPATGSQTTITAVPARAVSLTAPDLNVATGATVNLSGGGDLYAYEWVPGTGGTTDALGQNAANGLATIPGLYAVLPSTLGQYAPYDPQETPLAGVAPGASIYISGGGGLAAGVYPLLPARDALVPGAFLVQVQGGFNGIHPGQLGQLADGTPVVAGYLTFGTTNLHTGPDVGVAVWPGSYAQQLAQYQISDASTFFAAAATAAGGAVPTLPEDAGSLSISVTNALNFLGSVVGNQPNSGGQSSSIDLSAPDLVVTGTTPGPVADGEVAIAGSVLASWNAGHLVLGGHPSADGQSIAVAANDVTFEGGAQVSAGEVVVVANENIDLKNGASLLSTSATTGGAAPSTLPSPNFITLNSSNPGGAALLAVSDFSLPVVEPTANTTGGATVSIESGAKVASLGALSISGPGGVGILGQMNGAGASWSLSSGSIGFVGGGSSDDTLQINTALLTELQAAAAVRLASSGAINLYVPVQLGDNSSTGTPTLNSLSLLGNAIVNQGGADGTVFGAETLTLGNALGATQGNASGPPPAGTISFVAGTTMLGPGSLTVAGFQTTNILAQGAVIGQGLGGIAAGGNLAITTPELTAIAGAQTGLNAPNGSLALNTPASSVTMAPQPNGLGGELDLSAQSLQIAGAVVAPAGIINVTAVQDLDVAGSAVIDTSGRLLTIAGTTVGTEGGNIGLTAGGNLSLAAGSTVNVSGAGDAPAGNIVLTAGAAANLLSTFSGSASAGSQGGSFSVNAGSLTQGLTPLANVLQAGGFTAADSITVQTGDLTLAAAGRLAANQVTLEADTGEIDVAGQVNAASGALRGSIQLFGGLGVQIEPSAQLTATTSAGAGIGGNIELGTNAGGSIVLGNGAMLSATGTVADGTLMVRAPITTGDIALENDGANLTQFAQIAVEPIITLPIGTTFDAADMLAVESEVDSTLAMVGSAIQARLNPSGTLPLVVRPAVDLTQSGALTISSSINLNSHTQSTGDPYDLTFRAGGPITIGTTSGASVVVSDGFSTSAGALQLSSGESSSFRFVAGANASSPNPLAVVSGSDADLTLEPGATVRTGTGDIDLVASGNIVFTSPGTGAGASPSVYTAGINPLGADGTPIARIPVPNTNFYFNFPTDGGSIGLIAEGDILGAPVQQSVQGWQLREGSGGKKNPTQWGVDLDQFGWNVGSLGGGDVAVFAGGSISELSAAAADSYYHIATAGPLFTPSGGLVVNAGGDIGSSQFYAADGISMLRAGGAFSAIEPVAGDSTDAGSLISMGNAQVSVQARTGIFIDVIDNPTANTEVLLDPNDKIASSFFTYGADSSISLQTTDGSLQLANDPAHVDALMGSGGAQAISIIGQVLPGTVKAISLLGDVSIASAVLYPTNSGQLEIIAGQNVNDTSIVMSDAPAALVSTLSNPFDSSEGVSSNVAVAFSGALHVADPAPALIVAGQDISDMQLSIPKATDIIAGRDITNLFFLGQNLNPTDLTLISAGRDITQAVGSTIQVGGPGQVDALAGSNIDLGFSNGIQTVGNTVNPNLSSDGAALTVIAGLGAGPDYSRFISQVIAPNLANQNLLITYTESVTGEDNLTYNEAASTFEDLPVNQQRPLIDEVFFNQLSLSGIQANTDPAAGFSLGYAAIDALFPNSRSTAASNSSPYLGNIELTFSRIYTTNGGGISILAPGGELDVGLANPPASVQSKPASQLGIVAQGAGDIDIYTLGNVDVNASRIFTLGGGNILIWSDQGSIDAGRGAKSSVSAPPPQVLVDASGNVSLSFSGAVAGSGIRTIQIDPSVPAGNVNLIAPVGTVNAGDAGIGAAGNINIAAQTVLGASNINFGGTAAGVPAAVSSIGASLSGATSTASSASNSETSAAGTNSSASESAAPMAQSALSWLDVFVTGLGEEGCAPNDLDCLKRQKTTN